MSTRSYTRISIKYHIVCIRPDSTLVWSVIAIRLSSGSHDSTFLFLVCWSRCARGYVLDNDTYVIAWSLRAFKSAYILFPLCAVFFLEFLLFFLLFSSFFRFRFGRLLFHLVFLLWVLYYAVSSVSVSVATRLACDTCMILRSTYYTYPDICKSITFLFLSEVYDLFQLLLL